MINFRCFLSITKEYLKIKYQVEEEIKISFHNKKYGIFFILLLKLEENSKNLK
jgi:hypothetical protein